jgi:hypothetical protein
MLDTHRRFTINGRDHGLGKWGSPEPRLDYNWIIAEYLATRRAWDPEPPPAEPTTVNIKPGGRHQKHGQQRGIFVAVVARLLQKAIRTHQSATAKHTNAVAMIQKGFPGAAWSSAEMYRSQYGQRGESSRMSRRQEGHGTVGSSSESSPVSASSSASHSSSSSSSR